MFSKNMNRINGDKQAKHKLCICKAAVPPNVFHLMWSHVSVVAAGSLNRCSLLQLLVSGKAVDLL